MSNFGTMSGPYLDHVRAMFSSSTSRPTRVLRFSRLTHFNLRHINMEYLLFETMSGPCWGHVWSMFGLALIPEQLELWNFQSWVNIVYGVVFWSHARTMSGLYSETQTNWTESIYRNLNKLNWVNIKSLLIWAYLSFDPA